MDSEAIRCIIGSAAMTNAKITGNDIGTIISWLNIVIDLQIAFKPEYELYSDSLKGFNANRTRSRARFQRRQCTLTLLCSENYS